MSRIPLSQEFTDDVFTRDRRAWWEGFSTPGVNVCTGERMTATQAFDAYLPWTVTKVRLGEIEEFDMGDGETATMLGQEVSMLGHKRSDTAEVIGYSTDRFVVVQNQDVRDLVEGALEGTDYAVASIGALKGGRITFVSVDFAEAPNIEAGGQTILPYLAIVNAHDGGGSLKAYGTGIRPECMNTIDIGWLAGVQLGRLAHTTNIMSKVPNMQDEIRRYLGLAEKAQVTIERLIGMTVSASAYREAVERLTVIPDPVMIDGKVKNQAAITRAENRQERVLDMAFNDSRVGFECTAWGLFQTLSTYEQKERSVRRTGGIDSRAQSNLSALYSGKQILGDANSMTMALNALNVGGVKSTTKGLVLA